MVLSIGALFDHKLLPTDRKHHRWRIARVDAMAHLLCSMTKCALRAPLPHQGDEPGHTLLISIRHIRRDIMRLLVTRLGATDALGYR
jgi:hypothetical protein